MAKQNKHARRNKKQETSKWEELVQLKDETVKSLYENSMMMKELVSNLKVTITENPELTKVINGGMINFNHLAKAVTTNALAHYETKKVTNENGVEEEVIDNEKPRKGVVEEEDYMKYFQIYNNYVNAQSHAVNLLSKYSMEIVTLLQEKKVKGIELPKEDLDSLKLVADAMTVAAESYSKLTTEPEDNIKSLKEAIKKHQTANVVADPVKGEEDGKSESN